MIDRRIAKIKLRRGNEADRTGVIFEEGELVYAIDSKKIYVGDGNTSGGNLINPKISVLRSAPAINGTGDIYFNQNEDRGYIRDGTTWKMIGGKPDDKTMEFQFGHFQLKEGGIKGNHIGEIHTYNSGLSSLSGQGVFINYDPAQFNVVDGVFKILPSGSTNVYSDGAIINSISGLSANVDNNTIQIIGNQLAVKNIYNSQIVGGITPNKVTDTFANSASGLYIDEYGMSIKTLSSDLSFDVDGNLRLNPDQFNNLKSNNGYQIMPGGFITQWGQLSPLTANVFKTILFPLSTWAVCYNVQVTMSYSSIINNNFAPVIRNITLSSFDVAIDYSASTTTPDSVTIYWTAIGYLNS
jgi:hypothetical protein